MSLVILTLACWLAAAVEMPARQRQQDRVLNGDAAIFVPPGTRTLAESLASIAKASGVLIGFETVLDVEQEPHRSERGSSLKGKTVGEALDDLVALDSRYAWREVSGVIHFRPRAAFDDPTHFLDRWVEGFQLKDALPLHATFQVHKIYRPDCVIRHPIYTDGREEFLANDSVLLRRLVSLDFRGGTVLHLMDEVVKAHGALHWNVTYRIPPERLHEASPRYEFAIFTFGVSTYVGGWWRMCAGDETRSAPGHP